MQSIRIVAMNVYTAKGQIQMQYEEIIQGLETYLTALAAREDSPPTEPIPVQPLPAHGMKKKRSVGMRLSESMNRDEMIEAILDHCGNETLDELMQTFGEGSAIAKLINRRHQAKLMPQMEYLDLEQSIDQMLQEARTRGNPFYEDVCKYMTRMGFKTDAEFYNSISMPRQQFARLRDAGHVLSKKTVLWIVVGLKLNYHEASDLLQKAGYSFRKNDTRDAVLAYIFRNTTYDLDMVNRVLDHFALPTLC